LRHGVENVQWIIMPLQTGDPTRQVAPLFPHPGMSIADTVAKGHFHSEVGSWKTVHPSAKVTQER